MPNPRDIVDRIAAIIDGHETCDRCDGWNRSSSYAIHVAEVLVAELGLSVEWASTRGNGTLSVMSAHSARDKAQRWPDSFGVASRYVTEWRDE